MLKYQSGTTYTISADEKIITTTVFAGRSPITEAVRSCVAKLVSGKIEEIVISGDDGSRHIITMS